LLTARAARLLDVAGKWKNRDGDTIDVFAPGLRERPYLQKVDETHPAFDALHKVLLYPYGEKGWMICCHKVPPGGPTDARFTIWDTHAGMWAEPGTRLTDPNQAAPKTPSSGKQVSCLDYYAYSLYTRGPHLESHFYAERLFQEKLCGEAAKISTQRLRYVTSKEGQKKIRASSYGTLRDTVSATPAAEAVACGKRVILPSTHVGSPRYMAKQYRDAMAIVRAYGRPSLFVTCTCNPYWPEIMAAIWPGTCPYERPDIIARVFHAKARDLQNDLRSGRCFGTVVAYLEVALEAVSS
jgi:hypothetical protein